MNPDEITIADEPTCPYEPGSPVASLWQDMILRRATAAETDERAAKYEERAAQWRESASALRREADAFEAAIASLLNNV